MEAIATNRQRPGRRARRALPVDFTPLVDLGFLLITFFVFTSRLQAPTAMQAMLPKEGMATLIAASGALTVLPDAQGLWWYAGKQPMQAKDMQFLPVEQWPAFRSLLQAAKTHAAQLPTGAKPLMVIIKPTDQSSFGMVVRVLNEMTISGMASYALTDAADEELALMHQP